MIVESDFVNKIGHISDKKLFDVLYPNTKKIRKDSVVKPSALSIKVCDNDKESEAYLTSILSKMELLRHYDVRIYYIAQLQLIGGLRISEVLQLKSSDITITGHIIINSLKKSNDKVIHGGIAIEYLLNCRARSIDPFRDFNRYLIYRIYKKNGLIFQSKYSNRLSITHLFRHLNALSLRKENVKDSLLTEHMRHKNSANTLIYGKTK